MIAIDPKDDGSPLAASEPLDAGDLEREALRGLPGLYELAFLVCGDRAGAEKLGALVTGSFVPALLERPDRLHLRRHLLSRLLGILFKREHRRWRFTRLADEVSSRPEGKSSAFLLGAIGGLSPRARAVYALRECWRLEVEEIAVLLGDDTAVVLNWLLRARGEVLGSLGKGLHLSELPARHSQEALARWNFLRRRPEARRRKPRNVPQHSIPDSEADESTKPRRASLRSFAYDCVPLPRLCAALDRGEAFTADECAHFEDCRPCRERFSVLVSVPALFEDILCRLSPWKNRSPAQFAPHPDGEGAATPDVVQTSRQLADFRQKRREHRLWHWRTALTSAKEAAHHDEHGSGDALGPERFVTRSDRERRRELMLALFLLVLVLALVLGAGFNPWGAKSLSLTAPWGDDEAIGAPPPQAWAFQGRRSYSPASGSALGTFTESADDVPDAAFPAVELGDDFAIVALREPDASWAPAPSITDPGHGEFLVKARVLGTVSDDGGLRLSRLRLTRAYRTETLRWVPLLRDETPPDPVLTPPPGPAIPGTSGALVFRRVEDREALASFQALPRDAEPRVRVRGALPDSRALWARFSVEHGTLTPLCEDLDEAETLLRLLQADPVRLDDDAAASGRDLSDAELCALLGAGVIESRRLRQSLALARSLVKAGSTQACEAATRYVRRARQAGVLETRIRDWELRQWDALLEEAAPAQRRGLLTGIIPALGGPRALETLRKSHAEDRVNANFDLLVFTEAARHLREGQAPALEWMAELAEETHDQEDAGVLSPSQARTARLDLLIGALGHDTGAPSAPFPFPGLLPGQSLQSSAFTPAEYQRVLVLDDEDAQPPSPALLRRIGAAFDAWSAAASTTPDDQAITDELRDHGDFLLARTGDSPAYARLKARTLAAAVALRNAGAESEQDRRVFVRRASLLRRIHGGKGPVPHHRFLNAWWSYWGPDGD